MVNGEPLHGEAPVPAKDGAFGENFTCSDKNIPVSCRAVG